MAELLLHGYWRSSAAYRVRIALNLKGLSYDQDTHNLRKGEQRAPEYLALAPQGLVPALQVGSTILTQSPAIMEWLEETYPEPPLLPKDADGRAAVRAMAAAVACDIHPVNNLRILKALRSRFGADEAAVNAWVAQWVQEGFSGLEQLIARYGGGFCYGETPTLADCCLVPQVYNAERFGVDLSAYPRLVQAAERARALPAFQAARPEVQPDADVG
jgi:maleylpyruvate isomerase